jgi:hypothetical protein
VAGGYTTGAVNSGNGIAASIAPASLKAKKGPDTLRYLPLTGVACTTRTTCVGTATGTIVRITAATGKLKASGKVPQPRSGNAAVRTLACPSSSTCYAVGFKGTEQSTSALIVHLSGSGAVLGTITDKVSTNVATITCSTKTICLMGAAHSGGAEDIQVLKNGKPGSEHRLPLNKFIEALACHGTGICYALMGSLGTTHKANVLLSLSPKTGAPGKSVQLPSSFHGGSLACASSSRCVVTGSEVTGSSQKEGAIVVTRGTPGKFKRLSGVPESVACSSSTLCVAVGTATGHTVGGVVDRISV